MDPVPLGSPQEDFVKEKILHPENKTTDCFFTYSIPFSGNHKIQFAWMNMLEYYPLHGDIIPQSCNDITIAKLPPLKQFKLGINIDHIQCHDYFYLILKKEDRSPACASPMTAEKLIEIGWAEPQIISENKNETKPGPPTVAREAGRN